MNGNEKSKWKEYKDKIFDFFDPDGGSGAESERDRTFRKWRGIVLVGLIIFVGYSVVNAGINYGVGKFDQAVEAREEEKREKERKEEEDREKEKIANMSDNEKYVYLQDEVYRGDYAPDVKTQIEAFYSNLYQVTLPPSSYIFDATEEVNDSELMRRLGEEDVNYTSVYAVDYRDKITLFTVVEGWITHEVPESGTAFMVKRDNAYKYIEEEFYKEYIDENY